MEYLATNNGYHTDLLKAVVAINERQDVLPVRAMREEMGTLRGRQVAVLGLTYKPGTDDMREAPALRLVDALMEEGAVVRAYDPVAARRARALLPGSALVTATAAEALQGANAAVLVTEWPHMVSLPWPDVVHWMQPPRFVFDGRNALDEADMSRLGFHYRGVGRARAGRGTFITHE